eukprot:1959239-Alexandrium_andersonii.AAC.1
MLPSAGGSPLCVQVPRTPQGCQCRRSNDALGQCGPCTAPTCEVAPRLAQVPPYASPSPGQEQRSP